jgi:hypothetical protein
LFFGLQITAIFENLVMCFEKKKKSAKSGKLHVAQSLPGLCSRECFSFRLSIAPAPVAVAAELSTQTAPLQLCLNLGIGSQASGPREAPAEHGDTHPLDSANTPATSRKVGSFIYDKKRGIYPLQWEDLSSFHTWR